MGCVYLLALFFTGGTMAVVLVMQWPLGPAVAVPSALFAGCVIGGAMGAAMMRAFPNEFGGNMRRERVSRVTPAKIEAARRATRKPAPGRRRKGRGND